MVEAPAVPGYTVIVESIGSATPGVSKVLAEGLGLPVEIVLKALYSTPSVMFSNVDQETAAQTEDLLTKLGLETRVQSASDPVPESPETVDVGLYLHDASALPLVCQQLSEFIGCSDAEALNMLLAEPSVVLGGVSMSTAEALSKRVSAEVVVSNPKTELYTLMVKNSDEMLKHQLQNYFRHHNMDVDLSQSLAVEDLDYETTNAIWRKFQSTGLVQVVNQSFQRFEIILNEVDTSNANYRKVLTEHVGMPEEVIDEVLANLPIELETGLNRVDLAERLPAFKEAGLSWTANVLDTGRHYLIIEQMGNQEATRTILAQFFPQDELPVSAPWTSPSAMGDLLLRFATHQLEAAGCQLDYKPA